MFGISHVHVADDIDDAAVRLFGEAFVLATVARFHVENRDMQALCRNRREAAVGIAENQFWEPRWKLLNTKFIPERLEEIESLLKFSV